MSLDENVSVRMLSGEILLEDVWPDYLDSQVILALMKKGIHLPSPCNVERLNGVRYYLHYVGENQQHCTQFFLHGQKDLIVIPSSSRYYGLTEAEANSIRDEHCDWMREKADKMRCACILSRGFYTEDGEPIQHTSECCLGEYDCVERYA